MHRRRGVGVGGLRRKQQERERFKKKAEEESRVDAESVEKVLQTFKSTLATFAEKHRQKIKDDASFRSAFAEMCYAAGVDPLRSNKGFWSGLGLGDFYYELGVKVVGVCAATREENGGLIALDDLLDRLDDDQVSTDDIKWAVSKLKVLGDGFRVVGDAVVSVPAELSDDSAVALDAATADGSISVNELAKRLPGGDPTLRATTALAQLKDAGFAWVDAVDGKVYLPSLWLDARAKGR
jgi:ESCRT-II complex subunit VPS22